MIIVNKDFSDTYNMAYVTNIYKQCNVIKVRCGTNTIAGILGTYQTEEMADIAFKELIRQIKAKDEVCYMPDDSFVDSKIKVGRIRNITGKKTKGHGGS